MRKIFIKAWNKSSKRQLKLVCLERFFATKKSVHLMNFQAKLPQKIWWTVSAWSNTKQGMPVIFRR